MTIDIEIPLAGGGRLAGALARPASDGKRPGVIVIHEVFGDQPEIRDVCDAFAARGYVAAMPDLFSVGGPRAICIARAMIEASRGRPGRVSDYIEESRAWLARQDGVDPERMAVIGFCMGGGFALTYAATRPPGVRVAAINYGEVPSDAESLRGVCPVVASYGARDRVMGPKGERLRDHLEQLGIEHDVKIYSQAGHGFMTEGSHPIGKLIFLPMRLGYVPAPAADAWQRVFAFFDQHLKSA